jgi:hypothetical protein
VIEIAVERGFAGGGELELGARGATFEGLHHRDVPGFFQLARVDAEIAVARVQQALQIGEAERRFRGEGADDAEANPFVDQSIEVIGRGHDHARLGRSGRLAIGGARCDGAP